MSGQGISQFIPLLLIFIIFYFFLIRHQQKRVKDHKLMVESLKLNYLRYIQMSTWYFRNVTIFRHEVTFSVFSSYPMEIPNLKRQTRIPPGHGQVNARWWTSEAFQLLFSSQKNWLLVIVSSVLDHSPINWLPKNEWWERNLKQIKYKPHVISWTMIRN